MGTCGAHGGAVETHRGCETCGCSIRRLCFLKWAVSCDVRATSRCESLVRSNRHRPRLQRSLIYYRLPWEMASRARRDSDLFARGPMKSGVRRASREQTLSSDGGDGVAPSRPRGGGLLCGRFGGGLLAESVLQRVEGRRLLLRRHGKERVPGGGRLWRRLRNWRSCWRLDGRLLRRSEGRRGRREARLPGAGRLERGCPCLDLPSESTTMLGRPRGPRNTARAE